MFYDELKSVSIAAIEDAIAKAISELAGTNFTVHHLKYRSQQHPWSKGRYFSLTPRTILNWQSRMEAMKSFNRRSALLQT